MASSNIEAEKLCVLLRQGFPNNYTFIVHMPPFSTGCHNFSCMLANVFVSVDFSDSSRLGFIIQIRNGTTFADSSIHGEFLSYPKANFHTINCSRNPADNNPPSVSTSGGLTLHRNQAKPCVPFSFQFLLYTLIERCI